MRELGPREAADRLHALRRGVNPADEGWEAQVLAKLQYDYREEGNFLAPWLAITWARHRGLPVPDWALDYIVGRGAVINDILVNGSDRPEAEAVGRALGFGAGGPGQRSPAADRVAEERERSIAFTVILREEVEREQGHVSKREAAVNYAQEAFAVSRPAVFAALRKFGKSAAIEVQSVKAAFPEPDWSGQE